jgi:uncharacterized protein (DUF488 family)
VYYRRKILLALLQVFGGKLPKIDFQKYLFLFNINKTQPYFEFIPYKFGCFSFQANQDLSTLTKYNLVEESEKSWQLIRIDRHAKRKINYLSQLKTPDKILITEFYQQFKTLKGNELIKYVYEKYPYFATNSSIAKKVLDIKKYEAVVKSKPVKNDYALFTIGYEGKTVEKFTNELINEDVRVLCDIRKNAFSMKYGFSKKQLKYIVENTGIKYFHFPELGIESSRRKNLNSKKDYNTLFKEYEQNTLKNGNSELKELSKILIENKRIALMCFESNYQHCHRNFTAKGLSAILKNKYIVKHL